LQKNAFYDISSYFAHVVDDPDYGFEFAVLMESMEDKDGYVFNPYLRDIIGFDVCWLGAIETAYQLMPFADYLDVKYAVSVNSCTAALHLAMRVLNIKSGDEVIVPDVTFAATANAPIFVGAKPVFADIDEQTFNISINDIINKISRTYSGAGEVQETHLERQQEEGARYSAHR